MAVSQVVPHLMCVRVTDETAWIRRGEAPSVIDANPSANQRERESKIFYAFPGAWLVCC